VPSPEFSSTSSYLFLGAFTPEDELVGYACYGATPGTEGTYDLYWIAVDPAAQHGGVGTLLLHEVERRLLGHHARMLVVETSSRSDYAPTRGFYGRRGYAETARVREFYAPGDDRIILTKRFHSPQTGVGAASP
jgi:ribosomal protein S18 acetylase RimI-like enzyme